jgi:hypothetical protein
VCNGIFCGITHGKACAASSLIGLSGFVDSVAASIPADPDPLSFEEGREGHTDL